MSGPIWPLPITPIFEMVRLPSLNGMAEPYQRDTSERNHRKALHYRERQGDEPVSEIRTTRLVLRPWRDSDLEPFAALNADPRVMDSCRSRSTGRRATPWRAGSATGSRSGASACG